MQLVVALEQVYMRTPDGAVWTPEQFPASFFHRYLDVFDRVRVVARVASCASAAGEWKRLDDGPIELIALPAYHGPLGYALALPDIVSILRASLHGNEAVLLRVASPIATVLRSVISPDTPHAVEVVADPADSLGPHGIKHPLRPLLRWSMVHRLRKQCLTASAACYVTAQALQKRYPPGPNTATFSASDVFLPRDAFVPEPRKTSVGVPFRVLLIGSLTQLYKGPDLLVKAVADLKRSGVHVEADILGEGRYRTYIEELAVEHGVADRVHCLGRISAVDGVRAVIDRADLVVQPSRTEGLPRSLIEAMARGAPCVGTDVGGIPELLPKEDLLPVDDVKALGTAIQNYISSPLRRTEASSRNLSRAHAFCYDKLNETRVSFLKTVKTSALRKDRL